MKDQILFFYFKDYFSKLAFFGRLNVKFMTFLLKRVPLGFDFETHCIKSSLLR